MNAVEIARGVSLGELDPAVIVDAALRSIEAHDPAYHAFLHLASEQARAEAPTRHGPGPLAGVPVAIKDNLCVRGMPATCASKILEGFHPPYTATAVQRLIAAGAVVVGKTNLDEFAMGSSNENSAFGPTRNPRAPGRVPGGSSGGSAAAVAAGFVPLALGSDTGGSVRLPAAFCGVLGLKPTYGRVSRYGLIAFASSLDQIGVFARTTADLARGYLAIAGPDPFDATSVGAPVEAPRLDGQVKGLRVAVIEEAMGPANTPGTRAAVEASLEALRERGATCLTARLPTLDLGISAYYLISAPEASSNLARYDGVIYSSRPPEAAQAQLQELMDGSRGAGFGREVRRRILMGTYALSSGYYEAWYSKALKVRTLVARDFAQAFNSADLLLSPTSPTPAFPLGERTGDPMRMYLSDVDTVGPSLAGLPALSVPAGLEDGLPVGVQFIAPALQEGRLFAVAQALEEAFEGRFSVPVHAW